MSTSLFRGIFCLIKKEGSRSASLRFCFVHRCGAGRAARSGERVQRGGDDLAGCVEAGIALLHAYGERVGRVGIIGEADDPTVRVLVVQLRGAGLGADRVPTEHRVAVVVRDVVAHHLVERRGGRAVRQRVLGAGAAAPERGAARAHFAQRGAAGGF